MQQKEKDHKKISKFISYVLRHHPEELGIELDENGWAPVDRLIQKMNERAFDISPALLEEIVANNDKKRFAFNEDKTMIRASQGHSISIALNLAPANPPSILYHGTGEKNVTSILQTGLDKRERQHVHLSANLETAIAVGSRHGRPRVFEIPAHKMQQQGYLFYRSDNGVWLTEAVPAAFLQLNGDD